MFAGQRLNLLPMPPIHSCTAIPRPFALLLLLVLAGLAQASQPHDYRVAINEDMSRMSVEARFSAPVDNVSAAAGDAGRFLLDARDCSDGYGDSAIRLRNRRMMLPVGGIRCISYTVDMRAAADSVRHNRSLASHNVVVSPALWLWRPKVSGNAEILVRFDLPPDIRVAVPWPREGLADSFRLRASPESAHAPAVFGSFAYREIAVPGAILRVSMLSGGEKTGMTMDENSIAEWLRATATGVSLAYGRFPNPSPQIVVVPVDRRQQVRSSSAVPFGRVVRDGGEAVELFVDPRQTMKAFLQDWTATHEFSHLMLPYIEREHRWVSEGFAQYYGNVLLARAGTYDALTAWQKLHDGLERGRRSRPELSPNEVTARGAADGRMKIYWSGAAIALMADVTLRERSGGAMTLDDVMGRLRDCCLPSTRTWTAPELFATLDSLADSDVFMPLYRRYANTAGFPDTRPLFERLGLTVADQKVRLRRGAELQHIRSAITEWDRHAVARFDHLSGQDFPARPASGTAGYR
ncbi:MAG: hypothetical protein WD448_12500 [Woeseia sp.]